MSFVGGAGDFDAAGRIRNPDDFDKQIEGTMANLAEALASEACTFDDVVRLKAHYTAERDDWEVIAALARFFKADPCQRSVRSRSPCSPSPAKLYKFKLLPSAAGGRIPKSERSRAPYRLRGKRYSVSERSLGACAGEFIAVANRAAEDVDGVVGQPDDGVAQSHFIIEKHAETLAALGASFQDCVKLEGYYFGNTREQWAPLSKARASHFREPGPAGTVVPCHRLNPKGALTKVEVLAMRELRNGCDKYIPREDHWPARVWDWTYPTPCRQAIRLRNTVWLGGQVPSEPYCNKGHSVMEGQLMPQTRVTMSYIQNLLRAFGRSLADLKLMVCYFTETIAFAKTLADCVGGALPPMTARAEANDAQSQDYRGDLGRRSRLTAL
ncbi:MULTISPECIES: RidA family protein [unclassified Bradyrhizobium]|uniref:RidA family protein n=1 Tax=unclassified Bradyrhizobium TaxID=2631580 RepID=UPI001CD732C7|nr:MULTISPECIES: RidA family protein [unclassified Bradyrhizobium]MCA1386363.1 hypothetical protein [Bradyrhizobium sp. BRP05]MCA1394466.1 hypothetical protein [Bradyrhizobium sp. IC3123]MCA1423959.1 hypothetical protein [Bradyrhizobium sp. BRP23]MCA1431155.1 hypothetical protein [Bradyrhizobium sp. NBAIM16]MCA1480537.1 hypothetical protein [Bradyrhizobium sp. NBAIM08]